MKMNTIKSFQYGDTVIELAIPVDIDIDKVGQREAVLLFAIVQEQLKKLMEKINERNFT